MDRRQTENEIRLLSLLGGGARTSRELQDALGLSQPSVSRLINSLGARVLRLGRGRSSIYALPRELRGYGYEFPLFRVTQTGDVAPLGKLQTLQGNEYWWRPADGHGELFDHLPWFIQDMRPDGFMGRAFAHSNGALLGLPDRLQYWSDEHVLAALSRRGEDLMGNVIVGEESLGRYMEVAHRRQGAIAVDDRVNAYPRLVEAAMEGEPPGSSAAGEQPKFTAVVEADGGFRHVLVKFSPPVDSPGGRRWADLLVCEHIALGIIGQRGIKSATSNLVEAGQRYLLEVDRFDRVGRLGRLPMLSLLTVEAEFFGQLDNWISAASRFEDRGMLSGEDADNLRWLSVFGSLIANTDQHFGNVSLIMRDGGRRFSLAPAYDMLPMLYRPQGEEVPPRNFAPPLSPPARALGQWESAVRWAQEFWAVAGRDERISADFRRVCESNLRVLRGLAGGPRLL